MNTNPIHQKWQMCHPSIVSTLISCGICPMTSHCREERKREAKLTLEETIKRVTEENKKAAEVGAE